MPPGRRSVVATFAAACGLFLAGAIALLWGSGRAGPVVEWMNIYRLGDIRSLGGGLDFVLGLRVPIPPNLALVEIAEHRLTGDTRLATGLLYHAYVAVAYLCVLLLAYPHRVRLVVSTVLALLFVAGTRLIHPGNPQLYDVAAPCFFLLFVLLLRVGTETTRPRLAVCPSLPLGL